MVTETGIEGDRSFGLRDTETGNILTARRCPDLLFASARWHEGSVTITLPDGTETHEDQALSAWLQRPVELVSTGEAGTFENPLDVVNESDWVSWTGPTDSFHDSARNRISAVSLDSLGTWDERRFRKNIIVNIGGENELVGQTLHVGGATLTVTKQVARCVMVTRAQPDVDRDLNVFKTINRERDGNLGIAMTIDSPGVIQVGDAIV